MVVGTGKQVESDEQRRQGIVAALTPINSNYVWEIAQVEGDYRTPKIALWLVKIENGVLNRVQSYVSNKIDPRTIQWLSKSLVMENPEARLLTPEIMNYKHMLMCGKYVNEKFTQCEFTDEQKGFLQSQDINFDEIEALRLKISKALIPINGNYFWTISPFLNALTPEVESYSLKLTEIDSDIEILLGHLSLRDLKPYTVREFSKILVKAHPSSKVGYESPKTEDMDNTSLFGFYVTVMGNNERAGK